MDLYNHLRLKLSDIEFQKKVFKKTYQKGEYIYQPPEKPNEVFEIVRGVVKLGSYTLQGEDVCYDYLSNGEVIGNLRYLNGQFFEYAKAVTDLEVIIYDLSLYKYFIVHDPIVSEWFNKMVIARWCRIESRLFKICTLSPVDRVNQLFEDFSKKIPGPNLKYFWIPDLLKDKDIAHLTGLSRQTVAKILRTQGGRKHIIKSRFNRDQPEKVGRPSFQ